MEIAEKTRAREGVCHSYIYATKSEREIRERCRVGESTDARQTLLFTVKYSENSFWMGLSTFSSRTKSN